jgi:hypothetical protein
MSRRALSIMLCALIASSCGSTVPSAQTTLLAPSPVPTVATTSAPTATAAGPTLAPSPTLAPPKVVADLIADPLPAVTYADVAALDTNAATLDAILKLVPTVDQQYPTNQPSPGLATGAFLCVAPFRQASTAERLALRETHCLVLAAAGWLRYAASPEATSFTAARTAYALAATSLGVAGRTWLDAVLQATMPAVGAQPSPQPSPPALRSAKVFLATKFKRIDPKGLAAAVRDAVAADPVAASAWYSWMPIGIGSRTVKDSSGNTYQIAKAYVVDSPIEICAHRYPGAFNTWAPGSKYDLDMQDGCQFLVTMLFRAYQSTGSAVDWNAAVFALRMGIQGAPPCASLSVVGNGCPEEWLSGLAIGLGQ